MVGLFGIQMAFENQTFGIQPLFDHSKSRLRRISDPICIFKFAHPFCWNFGERLWIDGISNDCSELLLWPRVRRVQLHHVVAKLLRHQVSCRRFTNSCKKRIKIAVKRSSLASKNMRCDRLDFFGCPASKSNVNPRSMFWSSTVTIWIPNTWILDSMGSRYSNGKVKWLGRPSEYSTF